jgi:hypothetical protein
MGTLICMCGKEITAVRSKYCDGCRKERKKERARDEAKRHRQKYGSKVERSIYCSRCKGIKERQDRGYCLTCERERYYEKDKPDCSICNKTKENIRDAYCNGCKREKLRIKSAQEGRRPKNEFGRKTTCSNCGREKEGTYLNESYCSPCKLFRKKQLRPHRTDEQKFKDDVRRFTWLQIKKGLLVRLPCEVCKTNEKVEAHHDDYTKPLEVRWLCRKHHQEHHRKVLCGTI